MRGAAPCARRPLFWALAATLLASTPGRAGALSACAGGPDACTLREAAAAAGIYLGFALDRSVISDAAPGAALAAREASSVTAENAMKWRELSEAPGQYDFDDADALVAFAEANGQRVRGHTLLWGRANGPPGWWSADLASAPDPAQRARERIDAHVAAVAGRWAGRVESWDVVNEPFAIVGGALDAANPFQQALGGAYIERALRAAHAADPAARLFINEVLLELDGAKLDAMIGLASALLAAQTPLSGVGFQGHFLARPAFGDLRARLQRIADLGLDVELTEIDLPIALFAGTPDPLAAQAAAYADVVRACLAVSRCTGITLWGVEDGDTWLDHAPLWSALAPNRPLLFDESRDPKPAYFAVRDALIAVPEPGTALVTALGLLALAVRRAPRPARSSSRSSPPRPSSAGDTDSLRGVR